MGSNLGDSETILRKAVAQLSQILQPLTVASLYRSIPIADIPQPPFLNSAVTGRTDLSPGQLLACTKRLEQASGRIAGVRSGPRRLDIDLLIYGNLKQDLPELRIPHPELRNRRFVLEPLAEIAPSLAVPPDGLSVLELLVRLAPGQKVIRLQG